jgi:hypothetical protein
MEGEEEVVSPSAPCLIFIDWFALPTTINGPYHYKWGKILAFRIVGCLLKLGFS